MGLGLRVPGLPEGPLTFFVAKCSRQQDPLDSVSILCRVTGCVSQRQGFPTSNDGWCLEVHPGQLLLSRVLLPQVLGNGCGDAPQELGWSGVWPVVLVYSKHPLHFEMHNTV